MSRVKVIQHRFVECLPEVLESGIVYVLVRFRLGLHLCCCGCGHEVATPFAPDEWQLMYDGRSITLDPSVGNRSLPCRSHYWIDRNRVRWLPVFPTSEKEPNVLARLWRWLRQDL